MSLPHFISDNIRGRLEFACHWFWEPPIGVMSLVLGQERPDGKSGVIFERVPYMSIKKWEKVTGCLALIGARRRLKRLVYSSLLHPIDRITDQQLIIGLHFVQPPHVLP
jgi:hypothetical protein